MGAGKPEEYLNPIVHKRGELISHKDFLQPTVDAYFERIKKGQSVNGIFGIKIHYIHLARVPDAIERLPQLLPGAKYISVTRRNILRQAISASRATQTQAWTSHLPEQKRPRFNYLGVLKHLILSAQEIELWERFYATHGIQPFRVLYEDLDQHYEKTMQEVLSFLGLTGAIPPPPIKKQSDALTEAWAERCSNVFRKKGMLNRIVRFLTQRQ